MEYRKALGLLALAGFVAGCGGGGSGPSASAPAGADFAFGEASGRAAISNPPVSTSSQYIIGTAFTGTFSSLKIRELSPSLLETRIVAASDLFGAGAGLVSYAIDGSDPQKITPPADVDLYPSTATNGKVVFERVFGGPVAAAGTEPIAKPSTSPPLITPAIWMVNMDGTSPVQMAPAGFNPCFDNAGDKFVFVLDGTHIDMENASTKATTNIPLPTNDGIWADALSPDGNTVYAVLSLSGTFTLYSMPASGAGGSSTLSTVGTSSIQSMAISPDGSEVAMLESGSPAQLLRFGTGGGETASPVPLPSSSAQGISYSADGKELVVGTAEGTDSIGLFTEDIGSSTFDRISPTIDATDLPSWTGFIKDRTLIAGGGGLLGTRACGVILGQRAVGGTTSVVAFDVTTPSSVVMTAQGGSLISATNLVFSVDADSITKLAYTNTTSWRGIRAIGSGTPVTSANGALVDIDGYTGAVVSLLPFSGTRSVDSKPKVTDNGSIRTFTGSFLAVYDKDGKNLAPNGASTVKLNTKTNTLTVG